MKGIVPDVVDDHYYMRESASFSGSKHYDNSDRTGPKIFIGEWATREGSPTPNFGAALGDAAWMTGMERNSDLIVMSGYAPLFVNVNPGGMQWSTDLIGYDALNSLARRPTTRRSCLLRAWATTRRSRHSRERERSSSIPLLPRPTRSA